MADKLDKWFFDKQSKRAFRSYKVAYREDGEKKPYYETCRHLHYPVSSPPPWELVVPARCKQLLTIGLGNKLNGKEEEKKDSVLHVKALVH